MCGGQCVDTQFDAANCGACGNSCGYGSCSFGTCKCYGTTCGDKCCGPWETCELGKCVTSVPDGGGGTGGGGPDGGDPFSCAGYCGGKAPGGCFCDSICTQQGDCCKDKLLVCGP